MADIGAGLARLLADKVRLADQLEQIANTRRQTALVLGQTCAVGGYSRHGGRRQRRHALFRGAGFHQLRELLQAVFDQGNVLVEIHQHAEHFLKVRIEVLQGVIQLARADDDDLHLQRDHLWRQGYGGDAAQLAERRLHLQLARMQGTLERIPDKRLAQQLLRLQHQKAAVGTVHRTRTQLSVTGVKRTLIGVVFNTAEQVVVSRVRLEHHRRATAMVMAHYQAGAVLLLQQLAGLRVGLVHIHQLLDHGFQQVDLHRLQVGADPGIFRVALGQRRQQRLQRQADGFFIELTQLVARLTLPLRQARQLFVEALFQGRDIDVKTLALGLRQLGELGLVQRLAVLHRGEGDVAAVAVQGHLFFQRGALDHIQGAVVALVEDAVDGALLLLVRRMLEHRRKGRQQVVDQVIDIGQKGTRRARRQLQRPRLARFVEVIDVHPVRRCGQTLGFGLEVALHKREAPGAGLAHHIDVVTRPRHGHAKLQGIHRPLLAEHAAKGLQLVSTVEVELGGIKRTGQRFGRHPQGSRYRVGHGKSLGKRRASRQSGAHGKMCPFWRRPRSTGKAFAGLPGLLRQIGTAQAEGRGGQRLQARRGDSNAATLAQAIAAAAQPQLGLGRLRLAMLGLDQQRLQHLVVLPLASLLGRIRRMAASQVTADRRCPRRIFGFQAIENSLRIESRHGAHSCGKMVSVWLADGNLH